MRACVFLCCLQQWPMPHLSDLGKAAHNGFVERRLSRDGGLRIGVSAEIEQQLHESARVDAARFVLFRKRRSVCLCEACMRCCHALFVSEDALVCLCPSLSPSPLLRSRREPVVSSQRGRGGLHLRPQSAAHARRQFCSSGTPPAASSRPGDWFAPAATHRERERERERVCVCVCV